MLIGTCLNFDYIKGWGFITTAITPAELASDTRTDYFCHHSGIAFGERAKRKLVPGRHYEFELGERNGKPIAVNVREHHPDNL